MQTKPWSARILTLRMSRAGWLMRIAVGATLLFPAAGCMVAAVPAPKADFHGLTTQLKTDDLTNPLGIDDPAPRFSWQMRDSRTGARQTGYEVQVADSETAVQAGRANVWDSGRVASAQSVGVEYRGPALKPMTRYWWRVQVWDKDGKAFLPSSASWWETGLMHPIEAAQQQGAQWIGWQTAEENALRDADARWVTTPQTSVAIPAGATTENLAYQLRFLLRQPVKQAVLFVAGEDVASAWVNGKPVARGASIPPWHQFPWRKYLRIDVTQALHDGSNLLAIETTHYLDHPSTAEAPTPMSATLLVTGADGKITSFATADHAGSRADNWLVAVAPDHPTPGNSWTLAPNALPAAAWKPVVDFATTAAAKSMEEPLSKPWPAESVKALRQTFAIHKPIATARLYVTALGAYQMWVNGHRAGHAVLAPGWTDDRLRLVYQTYDVTHSLTHGQNWLPAGTRPRCNGSSSPTSMASRRLRWWPCSTLPTPMAAMTGWSRMDNGRPLNRRFSKRKSMTAKRRMRAWRCPAGRPQPSPQPIGSRWRFASPRWATCASSHRILSRSAWSDCYAPGR
jgi:alpha-L-rhamnosidase